MKNLRILLAIAVLIATLSSCKKAAVTDANILTSHKWKLTASTITYSDSAGVSHNQLANRLACYSGYTEFHDYSANSSLRLMYDYNTSTCPGYSTPSISSFSWNIDNDNANLYLYGSATDGTGGQWYTLTTINNSTLILTNVYQSPIGYTTSPPYTAIYDTQTSTMTYTAM